MERIIWTLSILIFFLDQLSKFFISQNFSPNEPTEIIKDIFYLTLVHNSGAAFGIFKNQTAVFIIISVLAVVYIVFYLRRAEEGSFLKSLALSLVLGGAVGNLADRLRFGYVIDFLDFRVWPVFNVADSAITAGAFLLIISLLGKKQCTRHSSK